MANFQYANNPQTTLSGSVTAGASSISVTSASGFPTRGKFTIIVDSEIMLVTGVSGTTWTVTRGYDDTSAAAHNNNAAVTGILTKKSFLNSQHVDVRAYGATGDGATDDTAAITAAIADIPASGGTLFFPPGTYLTTGGFVLSSTTRVVGEGSAARDDLAPRPALSRVLCTSATAALFTVEGHASTFDNIALECTAASPTAGGGIVVTAGDHARFRNVSVTGFWINIDIQDGAHWSMDDCHLWAPVKYALKIQHTDLPDGGDQSISNSHFNAHTRNADAAIRVESGGGLKITNCKINMNMGGTARFVNGIDLSVSPSIVTVDLLVSNTSIENVSGQGINMVTSATKPSTWAHVLLTGVQIALYAPNTTGSAVRIAADALGDIYDVVIEGCTFRGAPGSSAAAVHLINVQAVQVGSYTHTEFARGLTVAGSSDVAASPGGVVNYAKVTANQAGITTVTDVTGLSVGVVRRLAHMLKITARCRWSQSVAGDTVRFQLLRNSTVIQEWTDSAGDLNSQTFFDQVIDITPDSFGGTDTYKLTATLVIGAGNMTIQASATYPAFIMVEDLGPAQA